MTRIYTFTEDGDSLFLGRVELWHKREISLYSKVFKDSRSRDRWIKDKVRLLQLR